MEEILKALPGELSKLILSHNFEKIEEIRIRSNKPVILKFGVIEIVLKYIISNNEVVRILQNLCNNSIYAYQNQICNGFITINGGNRVGVCGNVVMKNGQVSNISYVNGLNIRIAHQIFGASDDLLKYVLDTEMNSIKNTLIVSPPGVGKTTIIRDLVKKISDGIPSINFKGLDVCVIDERGEIAAVNKGIQSLDVGLRTDVFDNIPKALGIRLAVRTMAPKVIVADEIGNLEDINVLDYAICSGVKCIFSAHGNSIEDLEKNKELDRILRENFFDVILFLDENNKGKIKKVVRF